MLDVEGKFIWSIKNIQIKKSDMISLSSRNLHLLSQCFFQDAQIFEEGLWNISVILKILLRPQFIISLFAISVIGIQNNKFPFFPFLQDIIISAITNY